jgi:hypothetical protein
MMLDILSIAFCLACFLFCVELNYLLEREKEEKECAEFEADRILKAYGDLLKITYNLPPALKSDNVDKELAP